MGASALQGTALTRVHWPEDSLFMPALGETADDSPGLAKDTALEIGQRFFAALFSFLLLEYEDGQRAKQREIARRDGVTHHATILILGAIPPIVLAVFDAPMSASDSQQTVRAGFFGPEGGHRKAGLVGLFNHLALAQDLCVAVMRTTCATPAKPISLGSVGAYHSWRVSRRPWSLSVVVA